MKQTVVLFLFVLLLPFSVMRGQGADLTGPLNIEDLLDLPGWFGEEYLGYAPNPVYLDPIPRFMSDVEIVCVLGTWCSDSKRDVPRMIRIFQMKNITPEKLRLVGVDRSKRDIGGVAQRYAIERVPTFVFLRNGKEIGRIVEAPLASLEKDMLGIIDPNAGKAAPPPPPHHMPPVTVEGADGTVEHHEHPHHPHEHPHHPDDPHHPHHPHHPQDQAHPEHEAPRPR
jgi:hypothetical protein